MRAVLREDQNGYLQAWLVRDNDPDDMAEQGIPLEPPDLDGIDWGNVQRDIHNALVKRGIFGKADLSGAQARMLPIVTRVVKKHVVLLYKEEAKNVN